MDKPKTFGIKLSELRPCDGCGGKLIPFFQHIQIRHAVFNTRNANAVLGTMQIWGKSSMGALKIAEALAPGADEAVEVLDEPDSILDVFLCNECFLAPIDLAAIVEKRHMAQSRLETNNAER